MTAGYPESHYQAVADLVRGKRKGYSRLVAEHFGVTLTTANGWISKARKKGYLPRYEDQPCRICGGTGKAPRRDPIAARDALGAKRRDDLAKRRTKLRGESGPEMLDMGNRPGHIIEADRD